MAKEDYDSSKIIGYAVSIHLLTILIVSFFIIVSYIFPSAIGYFFIPKSYFSLFYVLFFIATFALQFLSELFRTVLLATKNFNANNQFLLVAAIIQTLVYALGYFLVRYSSIDISTVKIFSVILFLQFIITGMSFYFFLTTYKDGFSLKNNSIRRPFIKYALVSYFSQIGQFLNKRLDVWFVEFYTGLKNLGIYALASQFTNFLLEGITPIQEVLKPYLVNMDRKEGNAVFVSFFKLVLYLTSITALTLFLISDGLVHLLFGSAFLDAIIPLKILCLGVVFIAIKRIFLSYNRAYNELKYNAWGQWSGVAVTVLLDIILIPDFGIIGAAIASTISYIISFLVVLMLFLKSQEVSISNLFIPTKAEVKLLVMYLRQTFSASR
jgi:O-antigen/teichoic acid export membrane protein